LGAVRPLIRSDYVNDREPGRGRCKFNLQALQQSFNATYQIRAASISNSSVEFPAQFADFLKSFSIRRRSTEAFLASISSKHLADARRDFLPYRTRLLPLVDSMTEDFYDP